MVFVLGGFFLRNHSPGNKTVRDIQKRFFVSGSQANFNHRKFTGVFRELPVNRSRSEIEKKFLA